MSVESDLRTRKALPEEYPALVEVLARAFAGDPFHCWLFPDAAARPRRQRRLFGRLLSVYGRYGVIETTDDLGAVAIWDPPRTAVEGLAETASFLFRVLPVFGLRAFAVLEGMAPLANLHPVEPHWYLSVLGSDPRFRGRGAGGSLLSSALDRCDREGAAAYLESSKEENVAYYERFGFEVVAPIRMPRGGPSLFRMKRPPAGDRVRTLGSPDTC
jgi:ribosomal protein S18 acetylase RimI-like enzyme